MEKQAKLSRIPNAVEFFQFRPHSLTLRVHLKEKSENEKNSDMLVYQYYK